MTRSKYLITVAVFFATFAALFGTGVGQILFAVLMFAGHFVGYTLWQAEAPSWWPFLFTFTILAIIFIGLRRWVLRRYYY